jgi:hypothetical protein
MKQHFFLTLTLFFVVVIFSACADQSEAGASESALMQKTEAPVLSHPSQGDMVTIENASALLLTDDEGASMSVRTSLLTPGHAYTAWWVIVNKPESCAVRPCTPTDILSNTEVVEADIGYADGLVADDRGTGNFAAYLPVGDLTDHWFGNGLTNPRGAEIHIVIHDHGPVIPELATNMLMTYRGGCTDGSLEPTFPDFTKEFGQAGNNICKLVQVVQFEQ